jgi:hypothetical protein
MKPKIIIAIILITLGIVAFAYQGTTYTNREKIVDLSPIQVRAETTKTLPLLPIVGAIAFCWLWEAKKSHVKQNNHVYRR